jgi:hypothetical protein
VGEEDPGDAAADGAAADERDAERVRHAESPRGKDRGVLTAGRSGGPVLGGDPRHPAEVAGYRG